MMGEVHCKTRSSSMFFTLRVSVNVLMQPDGFLKAYSSFKNDIIHEMPGIGFLV